MAMTGSEFITELCDTVGKKLTASAISGATLEDRALTFLNWGQKRIGRFYSFHELNANQESAATVDGVKRYPMVTGTNNLGLTRPKDIFTIRLIDSENSRKLERWSARRLDTTYPRPENYAEARPRIYARWGNNVEMFKIPDAAYTLYIRYPQWATDLTSGTTSNYENKDELVLTAGVFETYLALQEYADVAIWYQKLLGMLKDVVHAEGDVDWEPQAQPYGIPGYKSGTVYNDPYGGTDDPLYGYPE